jgi:undecaprenyl diphosphate synthase
MDTVYAKYAAGDNVKNIPRHVAVIMDGNGRWAEARGLPKIAGHQAGAKRVKEIVTAAAELGIKVLTLYTFSTENWKRPKHEIDALFGLLDNYIKAEEASLQKNNIKLLVTGDIEGLPDPVKSNIKKTIISTKDNEALTLNLALNYGSRSEITRAARALASEAKAGSIDPGNIDEKMFSERLYTKGLPDPDLLVRTSGEYRVSNFLLWQISYAEIYITQTLWPDFGKSDLEKAIKDYAARVRRYGG